MLVRSIQTIGALWPVCECGHLAQSHDENLRCGSVGRGQCPTCGQHSEKHVPCPCKKYTGPTLDEFIRIHLTPEEVDYYHFKISK